ncbi:Do family serine endopeptidase [Undibacterium sp.]|uniref:Do family serine endopeptidase n=1 Tax=Undibacterium sp. TaxID=1914977 RepID=UPI00374DD7BA
MKNQVFAKSLISAAVVAAAVGGYVYLEGGNISKVQAANVAESTLPVSHTVSAGIATTTDFSGIVDRYGAAVVNISVIGKTHKVSMRDPQDDDDDDEGGQQQDPLSEFFRRFGPQMPNMPHSPHGQGGGTMRGLGSGFIVSHDGLILTNAHVVDGAQEVTVKLTDRREFKAKVLGADKRADVAVIKIDAKDLPTVVLGDPALTKVGEPVLAIGSPFGFENTATAGIVSAKSRTLPGDPSVGFMQTDVAVNPGNSGGPLFNLKGEVIAINSQIYSQTGGYQGLSFAVPIDVANKVQAQLIKYGKVTRGYLGVYTQELDQALANSFGLKKTEGALISSTEKDSPAEKAGLQPGDVIIGFNGKTVEHASDLSGIVGDLAPGTTGTLDVIRKGDPIKLGVTIGELKNARLAQSDDPKLSKGRLGVTVRPLEREEQRQSGLNKGLVVEQVAGAAAKAGIEPGDVILSINGVTVNDGKQFQGMVQKAGKTIALLVQREDAKIFIPVDLG